MLQAPAGRRKSHRHRLQAPSLPGLWWKPQTAIAAHLACPRGNLGIPLFGCRRSGFQTRDDIVCKRIQKLASLWLRGHGVFRLITKPPAASIRINLWELCKLRSRQGRYPSLRSPSRMSGWCCPSARILSRGDGCAVAMYRPWLAFFCSGEFICQPPNGD